MEPSNIGFVSEVSRFGSKGAGGSGTGRFPLRRLKLARKQAVPQAVEETAERGKSSRQTKENRTRKRHLKGGGGKTHGEGSPPFRRGRVARLQRILLLLWEEKYYSKSVFGWGRSTKRGSFWEEGGKSTASVNAAQERFFYPKSDTQPAFCSANG